MLRTLSRLPLQRLATISAPRAVSLSSAASADTKEGGVFDKIACIGTGKMAQALLQPLVQQGVQPADKITIYDVNVPTMEQVADRFGFQTAASIPELVDGAGLVLCCVKPQNLTKSFFEELSKTDNSQSILLSIIAGKTIDVFYQGGFEKIVRSMPNTPAQIGQGMTVWSCTPNLTKDERQKIREILSVCGKSVRAHSWRLTRNSFASKVHQITHATCHLALSTDVCR